MRAALALAITTTSRPVGNHDVAGAWRTYSRTHRLIRLRVTALPTRLLTVMPRRPCPSSDGPDATMTRKCRPWSFRPQLCAATNSRRFRIRKDRAQLHRFRGDTDRAWRARPGPTSSRPSPRDAGVPSRDGASTRRVRHGSSYACETRGSASDSCCVAGRYASRLTSPPRERTSILEGHRAVKPGTIGPTINRTDGR